MRRVLFALALLTGCTAPAVTCEPGGGPVCDGMRADPGWTGRVENGVPQVLVALCDGVPWEVTCSETSLRIEGDTPLCISAGPEATCEGGGSAYCIWVDCTGETIRGD